MTQHIEKMKEVSWKYYVQEKNGYGESRFKVKA